MRPTVADPTLIAICGLYCGTCGAYVTEKCGGCRQSEAKTGCCVRNCANQKGIFTCADCWSFFKAGNCGEFNHAAPQVFGLHFPADRPNCLKEVRRLGPNAYSQKMAGLGHTLFRQP